MYFSQDLAQFKEDFETPIKRGMSNKASMEALRLGRSRGKALHRLLHKCMLSRSKESLQGEEKLKGKNDYIVLCDLSPLQVSEESWDGVLLLDYIDVPVISTSSTSVSWRCLISTM